eukprot:TRINITY_DN2445_c0_g2_i1.p1 TRINITY_DN2445_c0_g2~~TRINITY_DN2445_c0_g2_i1.p1  ORF type:complete len:1477 (-),score=219.14 TRINITY_DN2445_c0_g2_i1:26-4456(-)
MQSGGEPSPAGYGVTGDADGHCARSGGLISPSSATATAGPARAAGGGVFDDSNERISVSSGDGSSSSTESRAVATGVHRPSPRGSSVALDCGRPADDRDGVTSSDVRLHKYNGRCADFTTMGNPDELAQLLASLQSDDSTLMTKSVVLGGAPVDHESIVLDVGKPIVKPTRGIRPDPSPQQAVTIRKKLSEAIDTKRTLRVTIRSSRPPWHLAMILFRPWTLFCLVVLFFLAIVVCGVAIIGGIPQVATDFDSFMESDGFASWSRDAYAAASSDTATTVPVRRLLPADALFLTRTISILYAPKDPGTELLTPRVLREIRDIEQKLREMQAYIDLCEGDDSDLMFERLCREGTSLANVVFPAVTENDNNISLLRFNGSGSDHLPLSWSVHFAIKQGLGEFVFPKASQNASRVLTGTVCEDEVTYPFLPAGMCKQWKDLGYCLPFSNYEAYMKDVCSKTCGFCSSGSSDSNGTSNEREPIAALRSTFSFRKFAYVSGASKFERAAGVDQVKKKWREFLIEVLDRWEKINSKRLHVLLTGDGVEGLQAVRAVQRDLYILGSIAFGFVTTYISFHSGSVLLAILGLALVLFSIPVTTILFLLISGTTEISLMFFLSVFITVGVGSDMIFVYTDFWKQSRCFSQNRATRLRFLYRQAGTTTVATTFTTSMSFMAQLISPLRSLREFGFFIAICVITAWLLMFFAYPAILVGVENLHRWMHIKAEKRDAHDAWKSFEQAYVVRLHEWKFTIPCLFLVGTVCFTWSAVDQMTIAMSAPTLFADDHPVEISKVYTKLFSAFDPMVAVEIGREATRCRDFGSNCDLHACKFFGRQLGSPDNCVCLTDQEEGHVCSNHEVSLLVIGDSHRRAKYRYTREGHLDYLRKRFPNRRIDVSDSTDWSATSLLSAEHWETGSERLAQVMVAPIATVVEDGSKTACRVRDTCFCGIERCGGVGLRFASELRLSDGAITMNTRQLQSPYTWEPQPFAPSGGDVQIVIGVFPSGKQILIGESTLPKYMISDSFRLEDPHAQRGLLRICTQYTEPLQVVRSLCWLKEFRDFVVERRGADGWPMRVNDDFNGEVFKYAWSHKLSNNKQVSSAIVFGTDLRVRASFFEAAIGIARYPSLDEIATLESAWNTYLSDFDKEAHASFKGAWHTSNMWVLAEARREIMTGTLSSIIISLCCVVCGVIVFTANVRLAIFVMLAVAGVVLLLFSVMIIVMRWSIGAIEVVSMIVFVGLAVDYCLHLAHKYHSCTAVCEDEADPQELIEEQLMTACRSLPPASSSLPSQQLQQLSASHQLSAKFVSAARNQGLPSRKMRVSVSEWPPSNSEGDQHEQLRLLRKNRSAERFERTKFAMERMGRAMIGSAITTTGCGISLLPCTIFVFRKIGFVVLTVSMSSLMFAMLALPALLMIAGPSTDDMQSIQSRMMRMARKCSIFFHGKDLWLGEEQDSQRRHILSMPNRRMSDTHSGFKASRSKAIAVR